jgi:putative selenium metabolism protein SsnA
MRSEENHYSEKTGEKEMIIYNACVITFENENRVLNDHAVLIRGNLIKDLGPSADILAKYPEEEKIDAGGKVLMPGQICAHTHFYGAYSRGLGNNLKPAKDFPEILANLWYKLDRALDPESVQLSAELFMIDAVKNGCTAFFDHHASPNFIDGSLDVIEDVVLKSGLRGSLCYEVTDRNGKDGAKAGIAENARFLKKIAKNNHGGRIGGAFGLHACLTLSEETLDECAAAIPQGFGYHVHLAESQEDEWDSLYRYNMRCGERLYKHGMLGDKTIVAHCVHINKREMDYLKETGTWISHQPRSNMNNAVGAAQVESMIDDGMKVCLGNDGFTFDMWSEWKMAYYLHKVVNRDPRRGNAYAIQQMAAYNNAALAGQAFGFGDKFGKVVVDAPADLIIVDFKPFTDFNAGNLPWQIIFGWSERMITDTIADGKFVMRDRKLTTIDEEAVYAHSMEVYPRVWAKYHEYCDKEG